MPTVRLYVLGGFRLLIGDLPIEEFRSDKVRALLAYLALVEQQTMARTYLSELLWDGYRTASALNSLRQALSNLRQLPLPKGLLTTSRLAVQFNNRHPEFWCDALELDSAWRVATTTSGEQALARYDSVRLGELLPGFDHVDSLPYLRWLQMHRSHLAAKAATIRIVVTPPRDTYIGNLPRLLTTFVGRRTEITQLSADLLNEKRSLITLLGAGGMGKTRLALAVAEQMEPHFVDGVWFVDLGEVQANDFSAERLAALIGHAIGFEFSGQFPLFEQLTRYLHNKLCLLILDNFEHLIEYSQLIVDLLQATRNLKLLITSRRRLNLLAEHVFPLNGLACPELPDQSNQPLDTPLAENVNEYESVQLFIQRAKRVHPRFHPTAENLAAIAAICQLVDGIPLAIELAATSIRQYDIAELVTNLHQNLQQLTTTVRDFPERQRSMESVLTHSWRFLSAKQARTLASCSIFAGSFSVAAAQEIVGATQAELSILEDQSLLTLVEDQRYSVHQLVRHYARSRLTAVAGTQLRERHSQYFTNLLGQLAPRLTSGDGALAQLRSDMPNIYSAWQYARETDRYELQLQMSYGLTQYYSSIDTARVGVYFFGDTLTALRATIANQPAPTCLQVQLLGTLLSCVATLAMATGEVELVASSANEALSIGQNLNDHELIARSLYSLALTDYWHGDFANAEQRANQSLNLSQMASLTWLRVNVLNSLGLIRIKQERLEDALDLFQQALHLARQAQYRSMGIMISGNLGHAYLYLGYLFRSLTYFQSTIAAARAAGQRYTVVVSLANIGVVLAYSGQLLAAKSSFEESQRLATEIDHVVIDEFLQLRLGWIVRGLQGPDAAVDYFQACVQRSAAKQLLTLQFEALLELGWTFLSLKRYSEAEQALHRALQMVSGDGQKGLVMLGNALLSAVMLAQNRLNEAMQHAEFIIAHMSASKGFTSLTPALIGLCCYRTLQAACDARAQSVLQFAYDYVQQQAAEFADPDLRHSYLNNVAENRELIALVEDRQGDKVRG